MREERVKDFAELAKNFPEGVEVYARVVHGGPERQILLAAEETVSSVVNRH